MMSESKGMTPVKSHGDGGGIIDEGIVSTKELSDEKEMM